jgi:hypothetical protein
MKPILYFFIIMLGIMAFSTYTPQQVKEKRIELMKGYMPIQKIQGDER